MRGATRPGARALWRAPFVVLGAWGAPAADGIVRETGGSRGAESGHRAARTYRIVP